MLGRLWQFVSHYKISDDITVIERKRIVLINQMLFGALLWWTIYGGYLLLAFAYLLLLDPARYGHYFIGGMPITGIWFFLIVIFFVRPRGGDPFIVYIMTGLVTGAGLAVSSIFYGAGLSLELAALEIKRFMLEVQRLKQQQNEPYWQLRIGVPGEVNISQSTYEKVKDFVDCEFRGEVPAPQLRLEGGFQFTPQVKS